MKKVVGYLISGVGILFLFLGVFKLNVPILTSYSAYFDLVGIVLVFVGVIFLAGNKRKTKKEKQSEEEVPIYQGTGKKRKIVGYRRD